MPRAKSRFAISEVSWSERRLRAHSKSKPSEPSRSTPRLGNRVNNRLRNRAPVLAVRLVNARMGLLRRRPPTGQSAGPKKSATGANEPSSTSCATSSATSSSLQNVDRCGAPTLIEAFEPDGDGASACAPSNDDDRFDDSVARFAEGR